MKVTFLIGLSFIENLNLFQDVSRDLVEKEFWRKIFDSQSTVSVKYGADLLASKVSIFFIAKEIDEKNFHNR